MNTNGMRWNAMLGASGIACVALALCSVTADAQQNRPGSEASAQTVFFPSGDRGNADLKLDVLAPDSVRVGEPAEYRVRVTNVSESPLAGVTVVQNFSDGLEVDAAGEKQTQPQQQRSQQQGQDARNQPQQSQQQKAKQHQHEQQKQHAKIQQRQGQQRWNVGELEAGESREMQMTVIPGSEGSAGVCLTALYQPAICTVFEVTQPDIRIRKDGPASAYVCEDFEWRYIVENTGSGEARNVRLEDRLPGGLITADGQERIQRDIGTLGAGEQQEIRVQLSPQRTGQFASRARLTSDSAEARSNDVGTEVVDSALQVSVSGPEWTYADELVTYSISVTNNGDAAAQDARLNVTINGANAGSKERNIGQLEPGQTIQADLTVDPKSAAERVELIAQAQSLCAQGEDRARDRIATNIRRMPALLLECVDNVDPVRVGDHTTYAIKIKNQGNAPAGNVKLTAEIPQEMSVVDATGDVQGQVEGNMVTFGPIENVAPGDVVALWLEAKADNAADVTLRTELSADYLDQPVPDVEPTRLQPQPGQQASAQGAQQQGQEQQQGQQQARVQNQQS